MGQHVVYHMSPALMPYLMMLEGCIISAFHHHHQILLCLCVFQVEYTAHNIENHRPIQHFIFGSGYPSLIFNLSYSIQSILMIIGAHSTPISGGHG